MSSCTTAAGESKAALRLDGATGLRATLLTMPRSAALFLSVVTLSLCAQQVGQPLPAWTPGTLDIHHINTGRGNTALLILPDDTSMLLDAGDGGRVPPRGTVPKPDTSRPPEEWIT